MVKVDVQDMVGWVAPDLVHQATPALVPFSVRACHYGYQPERTSNND